MFQIRSPPVASTLEAGRRRPDGHRHGSHTATRSSNTARSQTAIEATLTLDYYLNYLCTERAGTQGHLYTSRRERQRRERPDLRWIGRLSRRRTELREGEEKKEGSCGFLLHASIAEGVCILFAYMYGLVDA